ncbi:ATP-grasp ribosomal peptide maturase [Kribbella speibonae]|uniref:ATP-grasp ribosomal peptide maturase n=1 Tax=Kribbella speibonae TaxID=1572660 RepID=A0A4R0I950_9ACTN|nr:ATP-grasp ribosomal peptide maturase [Kribbella speibonae]TCC27946.1 ATP-grasp ribosomal peptide maturase [Kribbella speibonae]TCC29503.1 ATP-grasp ribosomal peptide maturase [Kribbella speibonae]
MTDKDPRPVVIVTELDDAHADLVIAELVERDVPVARFDPCDFPDRLTMSAYIDGQDDLSGFLGWMTTPSRVVALGAVRSLYYRRPTSFSFAHLEPQAERFAAAQARFGLGGVLARLPGCRYVNHPHAIADAEYKPAQLAAAVGVGFDIPSTLITNDLTDAREFVAQQPTIYKPLYVGEYATDDGQPASIWVREVTAAELDDSVASTMHLFQARVEKLADLRVTVIGDKAFCVRIETADATQVDWRYDYDQLSYSVTRPPAGLVNSMQAYLKRFGLVFGCFDFALTKAGEPVFLECNPNGQWAWLEDETGEPMVAAMADLLQGVAR